VEDWVSQRESVRETDADIGVLLDTVASATDTRRLSAHDDDVFALGHLDAASARAAIKDAARRCAARFRQLHRFATIGALQRERTLLLDDTAAHATLHSLPMRTARCRTTIIACT
jgi:hypothetical protein